MSRKQNRLARLAEEINTRLQISSEAVQSAAAASESVTPEETNAVELAITTTAAGTEIDNSIDISLLSKWPKLKQKVPDIFLHKPVDFAQHVQKLLSMGVKFYKPYLSRYYTKITCPSLNDHKLLTQYFQKRQLPFNTFGNASKRKLKVVIRSLPKDMDLNLLKSELKSLNIPVMRVHKMKRQEFIKDRYSLILAVVPYNEEGKKLLQLKKVMGHDVKLEPPNPNIKQCHRCQLWGHTQRYCHGRIKCVKCAGEHFSKKCERDPKKEPPKCANCGGEHTASFKKCPCCPESIEHIHSQLVKHSKMQVLYRRTDLVTVENYDNLYKNIFYKKDLFDSVAF